MVGRPWTKQEKELILFNREQSYKSLSALLKSKLGAERSTESIRALLQRSKRLGTVLPLPPVGEGDLRLEAINKVTYKGFLDNLEDLLQSTSERVRPYVPKKNPRAQSFVHAISDWHYGKKVDVGYNKYNLQIAQERTIQLCKNFLDVLSYASQGIIIDEIVLLLIGDMVDNELIYDTQAHHIDANIIEQTQTVTESLWNYVATIRQSLDSQGLKIPIRIIGNRGNHGRTGTHTSEDSNWDIAVYRQLQLLGLKIGEYQKGWDMHYEISNADYSTFEIKGHKGMLRHMLPSQTVTPAARAKFLGWYNLHQCSFACGGHWHFPQICQINKIPIFQNGSLVGLDDLAERLSFNDEPAQLVWGVSHNRVKTHMYILDTKE